MSTLRTATIDDVPAIVALGAMFLAEPHYARLLGADEPALARYAISVIESDASDILVIETAGAIAGMIAVQAMAHPMSGEMRSAELFWYVKPTVRGSYGIILMKAAEQWARSKGAKTFQMSAPNARVAKLYERRGFEPVEMTYQKALT